MTAAQTGSPPALRHTHQGVEVAGPAGGQGHHSDRVLGAVAVEVADPARGLERDGGAVLAGPAAVTERDRSTMCAAR